MIALLELNHEVTPFKIREQLSSEIESIRTEVRLRFKSKCFILATCHRITIMGIDLGKAEIFTLLANYAPMLDVSHFLELKGQGALSHFMEISAGLHSKTVGEHEILGQIRRAYRSSTSLCPELHQLVKAAIHAGKRVRTETYIGRHATSLSSITIEKIIAHFPSCGAVKVLVLGTGDMAILVLNRLKSLPIGSITIASRNPSRAQSLASLFNQEGCATEEALGNLEQYDIIIGATHTHAPLITRSNLESTQRTRLLIDLGMPRNIDQQIADFEDIILYDLDNIQKNVEKHQKLRAKEVTEVYQILNEEQERFLKWLEFRVYVPEVIVLKKELQELKALTFETLEIEPSRTAKELNQAKYQIQGMIQAHFSLIISVLKSGISDQRIIDGYKAEILSDLAKSLKQVLNVSTNHSLA